MTTYRLQSAEFVHAPGLIAWAINGYYFEADRPTLLRVVKETWGVPEEAANALLSGKAPFTVEEETVVFTFPKEGSNG